MNWRLAKQTSSMTLGTLNSRGRISSKFCAESAFKGNNVFVTAAMLRDTKNTLCTCHMYNILIAMERESLLTSTGCNLITKANKMYYFSNLFC